MTLTDLVATFKVTQGLQPEADPEQSMQMVRHVPFRPDSRACTGVPYHAAQSIGGGANCSQPQSDAATSRFFDLPAEIRNLTYRELLLTQNAISRVPNPRFFTFSGPEKPLQIDAWDAWDGRSKIHVENIHLERSTCSMALLRVN